MHKKKGDVCVLIISADIAGIAYISGFSWFYTKLLGFECRNYACIFCCYYRNGRLNLRHFDTIRSSLILNP